METNEIMVNAEEAIEVCEEITTTNSGKAIKTIAKLGLTTLIGYGIYKKIIKPIIAKVKAKKEDKERTMDENKIIDGTDLGDTSWLEEESPFDEDLFKENE